MEFPKVLYSGVWNPEVGLGGLQAVTVTSAKEEKEQLKAGFVNAEDVESLTDGAKPKAKGNGDKKKADEE